MTATMAAADASIHYSSIVGQEGRGVGGGGE